jgi:hypothetical protein
LRMAVKGTSLTAHRPHQAKESLYRLRTIAVESTTGAAVVRKRVSS